MKSKTVIAKSLTLVALLLNTLPAMAQEKGHLKGHVVDQMGAAIGNTQIIIESAPAMFHTTADAMGEYDLKLPAGVYKLRTKKMPGFIPFQRKRVRIETDKTTTVNMELKVTLKDAICILYVTSSSTKKVRTPNGLRKN